MGIQKNSQAISPLNTFVLGKGKNQKNSQTVSFEFFDKGEGRHKKNSGG